MSTAIDPVETFRAEARELFEQLETTLLDIEADPSDKDLIDTAFRALHTIKGSGAMFGFDAASAFTHHVENAFDLVRKGKLAATKELVEVALAAKDHMRVLIEQPEAAPPGRSEALLAQLAGIIGIGPVVSVSSNDAHPPEPPPERTTYRLHFRLARNAMAMGANPLLLLKELRELGDCTMVTDTDGIPMLEEMDPSGCYLAWDGLLSTDQPRSAIDDVFMFVIDDMELSVEVVEPEAKRLGEILVERHAVSADALDKALDQQPRLGAMLVKEGLVSTDKVAAALAEQKHLKGEVEKVAKADAADIRVQASRLDELMDQVGELVIAQARLRQLANAGNDPHLKSLVEEIERLSSELRDTTMGIRMVPIGSLFGRFRRLVRDLSKELGKEIALTTSGEETELDKTVIERLHDPLVHLIRNSLDHGVEAPDIRESKGKPRQGTIHLSAIHSGAQVLIKITDDGAGIDPVRVRAKAEENGLIPPGAELSEPEIFQLILQPGFSTAAKVTSVSGRGVGMDVVKRAIDQLRGTIDIDSTLGSGSTMTLRLPLTLAIIDGLLVRVGEGRYVIPLSAVEECVELSAEDDRRASGRDFLNIRDETVPFLRLKALFNVVTDPEPYQKVVIVSTGDARVGLVVDQIIGDYQTVIKSLSKIHSTVQTFSGATILGDGTVALIIDVPRLIDFGQASESQKKAS
ncbi:CheA signal transduction histidine kinase [Paramagnetospirillum caucaseum]|uniref:Chemotaxis protein CheA n=1 Tax=Paramagnetospirillum caucaseum TaxID=1244869 RepID=M3A9V6_9PROT|nr:chemotaxis protein CheA [Paramagnetospirillum caucaseum]EME69553.1 CheA signal transduction histidine kinase [Paramagnetospirillum caucaseum]